MDDIRGDFSQKLETILPETRNTTNADCLALLMGDDPPQEIENLLYRLALPFLDVSTGPAPTLGIPSTERPNGGLVGPS